MGQVIPFPSVRPAWPATTTFLDKAERTFLNAVRCWVTGFRTDEDPMPLLCQDLQFVGARDAAFSLNAFMAVVADSARQAIAIHHPRCTDLSNDERHLLFAASLAQAGEIALAERALCGALISADGAEFAVGPLEGLAEFFAKAGLHFSRRQSPFDQTVH